MDIEKLHIQPLVEYSGSTPTEDECITFFRQQRENEGLLCKKCSSKNFYWLESKNKWQCTNCEHRISPKSGTIMEFSKVSYQHWFLTMNYVLNNKAPYSIPVIQKILKHPKYDTVLRLTNKVSSALEQEKIRFRFKSIDKQTKYNN